ncbi:MULTISPECIES: CinA family protein [Modicisalibacter]|uniref:CinA family protein n=1 Tax=Modicisalibacter TaxID=574347 RepID=UPI00100B2DC3|nr:MULTISPECIES: CinA family protein [Halomonadaceae]MBZ9557979.1 CinA family protein [Modicisalibacter sp. R2A 31.J]MBZ9573353.1 CinA family protein [Modicisalibacter sp. MOD 31.J]
MDWLEEVIQYLTDQKLQVTTAESCTAGLVVSELASVPGSGQSIDCGLAVYSPEAKNRYLNVPYEAMSRDGLTSEATSKAMALGALNNSAANLALANTGIAGPKPGDDGTPVGTVCLAWAFRHEGRVYVVSETQRLSGERNEVRLSAAHESLSRIPDLHRQVCDGDIAPL